MDHASNVAAAADHQPGEHERALGAAGLRFGGSSIVRRGFRQSLYGRHGAHTSFPCSDLASLVWQAFDRERSGLVEGRFTVLGGDFMGARLPPGSRATAHPYVQSARHEMPPANQERTVVPALMALPQSMHLPGYRAFMTL
jgi:hypothetical protein